MSDEKNNLYSRVQKALVGVLLSDGEETNRVLEIVTSEDFEEPNLQIIFEAITQVSRKDETVSVITVTAHLESEGNLAKVGGISELYNLRATGDTQKLEAPPETYAAVLKEFSAKRVAMGVINDAKDLFKPDSGNRTAESISLVQSELNQIQYKLSDESTVSEMANSMEEYEQLLKERKETAELNEGKSDGLQGIPSLLPSINRYTTGWLPGQLITVGARTGIGKSVYAVNCGVAAAQAGKSVLFFSLEMGVSEIKDRMIASVTGIPMNSLKQGRLKAEEYEQLRGAKGELDSMKLLIDTDPKVTVDSIRARALRRAQSPEGLDLIIVDYLQLITPTGRHSSRQEAIAEVSRNMKLLAKQLQVPVMVLVQVNRESKDDENAVPNLNQIRESGAIAQDSDIVILLHRESSLDDKIPHTLVILAKNRNGEANKTVRCHSNLECSVFREVQRAHDADGNVNEEDMNQLNDGDLDFDDDLEFTDDYDDESFEPGEGA